MREVPMNCPAKKPSTPESTASFVTTTQGMSGHFAVLMWWNPDLGGFWEPWNTGCGRYATQAEAESEAKGWAEAEELEFKPRGKS